MLAMKNVRVVSTTVMVAMKSNSMVGMVPFKDCFKGLSILCNIVDLFKLFSGCFSSFA